MTDQQALHQYSHQRDAHAFRHIVEQYQGLVYSAARRRLAHSHDIDDVVQLTFLKLAKSSGTIRGDGGNDGGGLASWLYTTTLNNANDLIRRDHTRRRHESLAPRPPSHSTESNADAIDQEEWQKLSPIIDQAILDLPAPERSLLIRHFFRGRSQRNLAAELNVTHPSIHRRLNNAIESLRKALRAHGHLPAAPALIGTLHALSQSPVPAPLTAQLTKIGLAGSGAKTAGATKARLLSSRAIWLTASILAILAVATLAIFAIKRSESPIVPAPAATAIAQSPAAAPAAQPLAAHPVVFTLEDHFAGPNFARQNIPPDNLSSWARAPSWARCMEIAVDAAGNIYAVGFDLDSDLKVCGLVREKLSGQLAWTTIFETPGFSIETVAVSPKGDLYVGSEGWHIYTRPAGQQKFLDSPIDVQALNNGVTLGMATDTRGNVYAVGIIAGHWIVRKQTNGTGAFVTVDDFVADYSAEMHLLDYATKVMVVDGKGPSRGVYVVGFCHDKTSSGNMADGVHWVVRKSADDGLSWSTVDDYVGEPSIEGARPNTVSADLAGNIYVSGYAGTHWITKKSATGDLNSWSVDDDIAMGKARGGGIDQAGNMYVVGADDSNDVHSVSGGSNMIRTNATGTWQTMYDHQRLYGEFWALTAGADGRLYIGGRGKNQTVGMPDEWLVYTAAPAVPAAPAKTQPDSQAIR